MKQLVNLFSQLSGAALLAVVLTGCGRGNYAMLPKTTPYHETYAAKVAVKPESAQPVTPEAAPAAQPAPVAAAPAASAPVAAAPVAPATTAPVAATSTEQAPAPAAAKPTAAQRMLAGKLMHKADKLLAKTQVQKHHNAASQKKANALNRYLKLGIVLLLIGVLLSVFGGPLGVVGYILGVIGVVFLILGILEEV